MKRLRLIRLGLGLGGGGGLTAWIRLGLMACGFSVGAALLLSAMSIVPGVHARDERESLAYGGYTPHPRSLLLRWENVQAVGDVQFQAHLVEPVGPNPPTPPGLPDIPGPGEIYASQHLVDVWPSLGATIEQRLHGRLVGVISPDAVGGPDTDLLWMGKPVGVDPPRAQAERYTAPSPDGEPMNPPLDLMALLGVVGIGCAIVLPIWLFVATATRLSTATRDARLAAVRLAGATETQVRSLAGLETGVAASLGTALGVPLFLAVRPTLAAGTIMGLQLYPTDLTPPIELAVIMLLALPVAAVVMSQATMRRLVVSPLGVARHARRRHPGWRWTVVLAAGVVLLAWCASEHDDLIKNGTALAAVLVTAALAATAIGLVGTAIWASWVIAHRFAPLVQRVAAMLGLRRLEADPTAIGRVVGAVALMIALVGVLQSGLLGIQRTEPGLSLVRWVDEAPASTIVVSSYPFQRSLVPVLQAIPGVRSVKVQRQTPSGAITKPASTVVLANDGDPATLEAVRDAVAWTGQASTIAQVRADLRDGSYDKTYIEPIRVGIMSITIFLLGVSAATLLVALVDWMMERRRSLAVLSAIGVGARVVRRSLLTQVMVPLATATTLGVGGAVTVSALFYTAVEQPVLIAWRSLAILSVTTFAIVLGVTALTTPWVRIARRPELLREA